MDSKDSNIYSRISLELSYIARVFAVYYLLSRAQQVTEKVKPVLTALP